MRHLTIAAEGLTLEHNEEAELAPQHSAEWADSVVRWCDLDLLAEVPVDAECCRHWDAHRTALAMFTRSARFMLVPMIRVHTQRRLVSLRKAARQDRGGGGGGGGGGGDGAGGDDERAELVGMAREYASVIVCREVARTLEIAAEASLYARESGSLGLTVAKRSQSSVHPLEDLMLLRERMPPHMLGGVSVFKAGHPSSDVESWASSIVVIIPNQGVLREVRPQQSEQRHKSASASGSTGGCDGEQRPPPCDYRLRPVTGGRSTALLAKPSRDYAIVALFGAGDCKTMAGISSAISEVLVLHRYAEDAPTLTEALERCGSRLVEPAARTHSPARC